MSGARSFGSPAKPWRGHKPIARRMLDEIIPGRLIPTVPSRLAVQSEIREVVEEVVENLLRRAAPR